MTEGNNYPNNFNNFCSYNQNDGYYQNQLTNKMASMDINTTNNYNHQTPYQDNIQNNSYDYSSLPNNSNFTPYYSYSNSNAYSQPYTTPISSYSENNYQTSNFSNNVTTANSQFPPQINSLTSMPPVITTIGNSSYPAYQNPPVTGYSGYNPPNPMSSYPNQMSQQKTLDPDNLPSAIEVITIDKTTKSGSFATGTEDTVPPLVTTDFTALDQGTCSPKFIRSSLYSMPATPDMLKNLHIPFVLSIVPFARLNTHEQQIVASDMGEKGPLRCLRCKAYMSPLMTFIDGGRRFQCNLCGQNTEVPEEFFSHLDSRGRRMDCYQRPELCLGSYELLATKEYCRNDTLPEPPAFLFLIDVSEYSMKSGLVNSFCRNLKDYILPNLPVDNLNPTIKPRVGFMTYDRVIHMYNLKSGLTRPQMYTVSLLTEDTGDTLVPLIDGLFVNVDEAIEQISMLMESIVEQFQDNNERTVILGPAIQAGMEALKAANNSPGKIFVLHSYLPNADAPGKLTSRDDRTILGTDKEKNLFASGSDYYTNLAKSCVEAGVSVDLFLTPSSYMDVATLSQLPKLTGGSLYKYDFFSPSNDEYQLISDLCTAVSKPCAFDAVMKVRTSLGTKAVNYFGNFFMDYTEDVKLACIDPDKSVLVEIMHNDKLKENDFVYVQVATLFTSISGQRRLRIHNTSFKVVANMQDIFKMAELDTIMNYFCKRAIQTFYKLKPSDVRQEISQKSAQILAAYRRQYGEQNKAAELILPENLKLLPLYANCLIKCDFMQSDNNSVPAKDAGTDLATDERAFQCFTMNDMNIKQSQVYLYPRLFNLKEIDENSNDLPTCLRNSSTKLTDDGLYLIENGLIMFLWVGSCLSKDWLVNLFNCSTTAEISDKISLPVLDNQISKSVHRIIQLIRESRNRQLKMRIVIQGDKLESQFKKLLVEDKNDRGFSSYVEFVYHIHKEIRTLLNK